MATPTSVASPLPGTLRDPLYPDSDGLPMGETDLHIAVITYLRDVLKYRYRQRTDVHVAADMFLYYEQGNPRANKSPDVMVSKGARGNHDRRSFRTWEEGVVPCVIFEISSEDTWDIDLEEKRLLYERLGVKEYFLFDPDGHYLSPALQGFRLEGETYVPLIPADDGSLVSEELELRLVPEGPVLRLVDLHTNEPLPDYIEQSLRAEALEAEVAKLRALLERKNGKE